MDRTAVQRAMWDRLEVEKNELKAEFGGRVDRLYDKMKLEVEQVYGHVETADLEDIAPIAPRSPSLLTTQNESLPNSIHQNNVDSNTDNYIITPPAAAKSTDQITNQTTEHHSNRTEPLMVNLIEGGQNIDAEQSSLPLADVASHSQPSSIHHHDIRVQTETVPFDSPNMSNSDHQPQNSQPNSVSQGSLTDAAQNANEMQPQIKQEFSDEPTITTTNNLNDQSNGGDFVKHEYFSDDSDCDSDCDCDCHGKHDRPSRPVTRTPNGTTQKIKEEGDAENESTNNDETVIQSSGDLFAPSTSTGQVSNRKRKQPTSKRSAKRSKITLQDDDEEGEEEIANEDQNEAKVIVLSLNCTESNCNAKLGSMTLLNDHLTTAHQLPPNQCFATNCNARFDNRMQIRNHVQLQHSRTTRFLCAVCRREYDSQGMAYRHWYYYHRTGQFKCNLVTDCDQVTDTWSRMRNHQKNQHHSQSKHLHCAHLGCTASAFRDNYELKVHERIHTDSNPFRCSWPHCQMRTKQRGNLIVHIRTQHFGLPKSVKEQEEKNIVDNRDPSQYVQVVVDE